MGSTLDKINKYIQSQNLNDLCYLLLDAFYKDSDRLVIRHFSKKQPSYIRDICGDNPFLFSVVLDDLRKHSIVHYSIPTDDMILTGLNFSFIRSLSFSKNSFKRKYKIKDLNLNPLKSNGVCKKGFRVPSTIFPYLTGSTLPDDHKLSLIKNNPENIILEEQRRSLPKEVIRVYCAFISLADKTGVVECDSCHTIYLSFVKQYGVKSFNLQSWYNSVQKLLDLKLLSLTPTGYQVSYISNKVKERYVIVPMVVFDKSFKDLELSSIRMFFEFIFSLNNGETFNKGKLENLKENKTYFIKFSGSGAEGPESREKIKRTMIQIRKRYSGELIKTLIGKDDFLALRKYFDFEVMPGCVFMVKLKSDYYISKDYDYAKDLLPLKADCHKRIHLLKHFFDEIGYLLDEHELLRIWRLLRDKTIYKLKKVLAAVREKSKKEHLNISALHLYVASV